MVTPKNIEPKDRIILPLDMSNVRSAFILAEKLKNHVGIFKIGLEFIYSTIGFMMTNPTGAAAYFSEVSRLIEIVGPRRIFLDGKFDDIPNTIAEASRAVATMKPMFFNVHASAGIESIRAAVKNRGESMVLGVTVLTSIEPDECISIFGSYPGSKVLDFVGMLEKAQAHGVICSPKEVALIRENSCYDQMTLVTPGTRPTWASTHDQKRVMTPREAIKAGADYIVCGRPITNYADPVEGAKLVAGEMEEAS